MYKKHGYNILQIRNETLIAFINNEIDNIKKRVARGKATLFYLYVAAGQIALKIHLKPVTINSFKKATASCTHIFVQSD